MRNKNNKTVFPVNGRIEKAAEEIRSREFSYLASFADIINRYMDLRFKKLNRLRYGVLSLLITRGGSLTHTRLAKLMFRSKHGITKVIDDLEKDGLVVRTPGSRDRRF
ncbi:MarR family winged helix-turn-helix transcriptional regulator, partial [Thermodesulfobacteriota bacterium]